MQPSARFAFIVGKGGVGKSTTSAAFALQLADAGKRVHLISTDPAHSLNDVFAGEKCAVTLEIEEFAAREYSDTWFASIRPALAELMERGTYFDSNDASSFLDLTFPGVDEVMAAFRLVELTAAKAEHIVVDTAPTGHTLRLLAAADVLDSWANALGAMMAKADAVAFALVGASPNLRATELLQDWRTRSVRYRELLREAEFFIITRNDDVVKAETVRLRAALDKRGLKVSATIANAGGSEDADYHVPLLPERPVGCAALRAWRIREGVEMHSPTHTQPRHVSVATAGPGTLLQIPVSLWLIAGKGGVGKSTCAAALGLGQSGQKPTCIISTDPAGSLSDVFGSTVGADATAVTPTLRAWQLDADRALKQVRSAYEGDVNAVFQRLGIDQTVALDRAVLERLWNLAPPGIDEIVALTELTAATENCASVVLDSAPTGHFLRLIALPQIAVDWAHALLRLLLKYHVAGSLDGFTQDVLAFARRTRELQERITNPRETAALLVTLDEPVVWAETDRLHAALEDAKIPVAALIINRADDGPLRGHPLLQKVTRVIRAPLLSEPPVGLARLREFLGRWELLA